jgi:hypothetical protein
MTLLSGDTHRPLRREHVASAAGEAFVVNEEPSPGPRAAWMTARAYETADVAAISWLPANVAPLVRAG